MIIPDPTGHVQRILGPAFQVRRPKPGDRTGAATVAIIVQRASTSIDAHWIRLTGELAPLGMYLDGLTSIETAIVCR